MISLKGINVKIMGAKFKGYESAQFLTTITVLCAKCEDPILFALSRVTVREIAGTADFIDFRVVAPGTLSSRFSEGDTEHKFKCVCGQDLGLTLGQFHYDPATEEFTNVPPAVLAAWERAARLRADTLRKELGGA